MGIDLGTERVVSLTQAARLLPPGRNGRPVHVSTLVRAIVRGNRQGVRLEALRLGSRWFTSTEAIQRWCERQTRLCDLPVTNKAPRLPRRKIERVEQELERRGF
jgi:uncharacterized protein DUF1580